MALCTNNISDFTVKEMVTGSDDYTNLVGAFVCQSTIIPSESKGFRAALSSQSIILADMFLGVTVDTALQNVNIKEDMFPVSPSQVPDVHFFYKSSTATTSCINGRSTAVKMRCNPMRPGAASVQLAPVMVVPSTFYGRVQKLALCAQNMTSMRSREPAREGFRKYYMYGMNLSGALKEFLCPKRSCQPAKLLTFG